MPTIYTNKDKTKFFYCNEQDQTIITIQRKLNGASMETITGKDVPRMMLELKHDSTYNFDLDAPIRCSRADFAEAFLQVQRTLANSLNSVNQIMYQEA